MLNCSVSCSPLVFELKIHFQDLIGTTQCLILVVPSQMVFKRSVYMIIHSTLFDSKWDAWFKLAMFVLTMVWVIFNSEWCDRWRWWYKCWICFSQRMIDSLVFGWHYLIFKRINVFSMMCYLYHCIVLLLCMFRIFMKLPLHILNSGKKKSNTNINTSRIRHVFISLQIGLCCWVIIKIAKNCN